MSVEATDKWLKSTKTTEDFLDDDGEIGITSVIDEAISLTETDFGKIDCFFIVVADSNNKFRNSAIASVGDWSFQIKGRNFQFSCVIISAQVFDWPYVNSHEIGHALFALYHEVGAKITQDGCGHQEGEAKYYSPFSVMGNEYSFFPAWAQYTFGWLNKKRVVILSSYVSVSVELELCPRELENTEEKQLIIIEIGKKALSLEIYEKKLEPYRFKAISVSKETSLLIRNHYDLVKTSIGRHNSLVFMQEPKDSFLQPGEEICDLGEKGNISIRYVSLEGEGENARAKVEIDIVGAPEPTPTPTPSPTPTPTPTPSPSSTPSPTPSATPTPTPTPCKAENITVSPNVMKLKKKTSGETTVTVTGADGCGVEGETVSAEVISAKRKLISVSPVEGKTDENGQAAFTITAGKKTGRAKIYFRTSRLESLMTVTISRK